MVIEFVQWLSAWSALQMKISLLCTQISTVSYSHSYLLLSFALLLSFT